MIGRRLLAGLGAIAGVFAAVACGSEDGTFFGELLATQADMECGGMGSTCDCPAADGYACIEGRCGWNYVSAELLP